ncbi:ets DNA-binding protein pokkuri [Nilaparvata lugens]|uniref:ets DNA-binding protein pokkuri n=1 Tax=Nilaparvata lugens TaxID=108931 RepID=UPI00193CD7F6|nr:ets DNA-binding protein pokkuri [Nilaparvata lugens]
MPSAGCDRNSATTTPVKNNYFFNFDPAFIGRFVDTNHTEIHSGMKLVPSRMLPPQSPGSLPAVFGAPPDLLWRYPLTLPPSATPANPYQPNSLDFRTQLPPALGSDPWQWSREDVVSFLRWCEFEFDLPQFDMDMFQMNGKALCLLTKSDLAERIPGSGDIVHNVLQMLMRCMGRRSPRHPHPTALPSSPLTPHFPLTPSWATCPPTIEFPTPSNTSSLPPHHHSSVNLSPAPSVDSGSSPDIPPSAYNQTDIPPNYSSSYNSGASSGSNQSDSDLDESTSPTPSPTVSQTPRTPTSPSAHSPLVAKMGGQYFFPNEPSNEPNTNGRLLWDFLQQLLEDSHQRYVAYIAWKNRDSGIFKIVDPPGLAKLWGIQKNHLSMNYDKMSRALRYYYRVNILRKVQGERHCYQFLRNPSELKSIKNISLLRQQMSAANNSTNASTNNTNTVANNSTNASNQPPSVEIFIKSEPFQEDDLRPTDLRINRTTPSTQDDDKSAVRWSSSAHAQQQQQRWSNDDEYSCSKPEDLRVSSASPPIQVTDSS